MVTALVAGLVSVFACYLCWSLNMLLVDKVPVSLHITTAVVMCVISGGTMMTFNRLRRQMPAAVEASDDGSRLREIKAAQVISVSAPSSQGVHAIWFGKN